MFVNGILVIEQLVIRQPKSSRNLQNYFAPYCSRRADEETLRDLLDFCKNPNQKTVAVGSVILWKDPYSFLSRGE